MRATAAILVDYNEPLIVEQVELEEPHTDEVLLRLQTSGICRSDISLIKGYWPGPLPLILGHEGAGVIEAVGPGVDPARLGEHVVVTFVPSCGRCRFCIDGLVNLCTAGVAAFESGRLRDGTTRIRWRNKPAYHLQYVSSFATHAVVPSNAAIPVAPTLDPATTCLLGCGASAGVLPVIKRANVRPGQSVAVFGCGGVGLSAILGAVLVSAHPIIGVDPSPDRRKLASSIGASHVIDPTVTDPVEAIRELLNGGADYAFEAIGKPEVAAQAFASTVRGRGVTVLIGQPAYGVEVSLPIYDLVQYEFAVIGSNIGGANPALDIPRLAGLLEANKLALDQIVTHRFSLNEINEAIAVVDSGEGGRAIIDLRED
jgi:S-(hydroxymethyl)glutathione dehydrogenase/alcohol dehydrogenase